MSSKASHKSENADNIVAINTSDLGITDVLKNNYMPYAMSVIISRAIPEIDGFKPAHRKLLYTMYRMGLLKGDRAKSADIVGQTMAYNPHGDTPIYETMVRMTRGNGALINPWIDSKGNFGRVYSRDMQYAAYRYTEARLDPSCEFIFGGLEKNAVDFVDNYSGKLQEPVLLPSALPAILINANQGIAVGMASNICSFNLREVCEATCAMIDDPEVDISKYMPAPDFSTGGKLLYDREQMEQIYATGRGSFELQGVTRIDKKHRRIEITEIPYNTTVEVIIDDIMRQVKKGKLKEITDVRDETDLSGLKLTIDYKRNTDEDMLLMKLLKSTSLSSNFTCNFNILIGTEPQVLGVKAILSHWLEWRRCCLARELSYDRDRLADKLHLLEGLQRILLDIDKTISIIRHTPKESEVITNLMRGFDIDKQQAEYIADIKLRHLNREYIINRTAEVEDLREEIDNLSKIIDSKRLLNKRIKQQLQLIAKRYGKDRLTELIKPSTLPEISEEDFIEDYNVKYFLTAEGYLKKIALTSLRSAGDLKLKDEDYVTYQLEGTNKSELLFFSDQGNVYKRRGYEFDTQRPSDLGTFLANDLDLNEGENIVAMHVTDEDYPGYLVLAFANGYVTKFRVDQYKTLTKRKRLTNAFYKKDPLVGLIYEAEEISREAFLLRLSNGKATRQVFIAGDLVETVAGKSARGKRVVKLPKGFKVDAFTAHELDEDRLAVEDGLEYYRVRTLPSAGKFLREEDIDQRVQQLIDFN